MAEHLPERDFEIHYEKEHPFTRKQLQLMVLHLRMFTPQEIADLWKVKIGDIYKHRTNIVQRSSATTFEGTLGWVLDKGIITVAEPVVM